MITVFSIFKASTLYRSSFVFYKNPKQDNQGDQGGQDDWGGQANQYDQGGQGDMGDQDD